MVAVSYSIANRLVPFPLLDLLLAQSIGVDFGLANGLGKREMARVE